MHDLTALDDPAEAIDKLGGGTKVAASLSAKAGIPIDREFVYQWKKRGVPWRWRPIFAELQDTAKVRAPGPRNAWPRPRGRNSKRRAA